MIEKPKRLKKIPNQDNKQPQTIQELIRRYDLDNTKIYDFLDELIGQLNFNEIKNYKELEKIDTKVTGTVLYKDEKGTSGNITLLESVANFSYIEIFYHREGAYELSAKFEKPDGKIGKLQEVGSQNLYFSIVAFSDTTIETNSYSKSVQIADGTQTTYDTNIFLITKVVGY